MELSSSEKLCRKTRGCSSCGAMKYRLSAQANMRTTPTASKAMPGTEFRHSRTFCSTVRITKLNAHGLSMPPWRMQRFMTKLPVTHDLSATALAFVKSDCITMHRRTPGRKPS